MGMISRRKNAQKLIQSGCMTTLGTDNYAGSSPEYLREPKPIWQEPGIGTLMAIEGLVELGMTPSQAIVAGTKNGAIASKGLKDFGTLEAGKLADLAVLTKDYMTVPVDQIGTIESVLTMVGGKIVYAAGNYAPLEEKSAR